jgi:hypothetical protein
MFLKTETNNFNPSNAGLIMAMMGAPYNENQPLKIESASIFLFACCVVSYSSSSSR